MLRNSLIALLVFGGLTLLLLMPRLRGSDPPPPERSAETQGLFDVNINVGDNDGVRVRAGLIDIRVGDNSRDADRDREMHGSDWLFRGSKLINTPVMDPKHEEIGRVADVVVDLRSGRVRYIAVEYPTLLGREKLFAVPWDRFQLAKHQQGGFYLVVNIDEKTFEQAPGFVRNRWPNFANRRWQEEVDVFYGVYVKPGDVKTRFGTSPDPVRWIEHLERVSKIPDFPVISDKSERRIGAVSDLVIDFDGGRMPYVVLKFDSPISRGRKDRFLVPYHRLDFEIEDGQPCLELEINLRRMSQAPRFRVGQWPDIQDSAYRTRINTFYEDDDD